MKSLWKLIYRLIVGVFLLFLILSFLLYLDFSRPVVSESSGFTNLNTNATDYTLSHKLPTTAHEIRHCRASLGMGGRLLIYRFSAPVADLHAHAQAEFASHWNKPLLKETPHSASPITEHDIAQYKSGFGIVADWMLPPPNATGTLYQSADGQSSHRPTIFVDESNGVLYFQMTD